MPTGLLILRPKPTGLLRQGCFSSRYATACLLGNASYSIVFAVALSPTTAFATVSDVKCSRVRTHPLLRLAEVAEDQWGLVTRQQAQAARVPRATFERLVAATSLERIDTGVYRIAGAPVPDHVELRAAWLHLAPGLQRWQRTIEQGVVSHRSAASLYGAGDLPADRHEFTVPMRRQSRKPGVRFHIRREGPGRWIEMSGLPVTRPSQIAADLLLDNEDPGAVAQIIATSLEKVYDYPGTFARSLAPSAARFGLRRHDGLALLAWLLDLVSHDNTGRWLQEARDSLAHRGSSRDPDPGGWEEPRSAVGDHR